MTKEFPLFPELSEEGQKQAERLIEKFKKAAMKAMEESMVEFYSESLLFIDSDSWGNFRNQIMDGFKNYNNRKIQNEYDFKTIRKQIYLEYREELIPDLNQDLVEEIATLKNDIEILQRHIDNQKRY